jgi:hypothetical protein
MHITCQQSKQLTYERLNFTKIFVLEKPKETRRLRDTHVNGILKLREILGKSDVNMW